MPEPAVNIPHKERTPAAIASMWEHLYIKRRKIADSPPERLLDALSTTHTNGGAELAMFAIVTSPLFE